MLGVAELGSVARDGAAYADEILRVELAAAAVALIAARGLGPAMRARPGNVAVGEEALIDDRVGHRHRGLVDVALVEEPVEDLMRRGRVVGRPCVGEEVPRNAEPPPGVLELGLITLDDFARRLALLVGPHGDRGTVPVAPGHHEDVVALQPVVAREDVGGEIGACDVAKMQRAIGVGPGDGDEDAFGHRDLWSMRLGVWSKR